MCERSCAWSISFVSPGAVEAAWQVTVANVEGSDEVVAGALPLPSRGVHDATSQATVKTAEVVEKVVL